MLPAISIPSMKQPIYIGMHIDQLPQVYLTFNTCSFSIFFFFLEKLNAWTLLGKKWLVEEETSKEIRDNENEEINKHDD